jgi:uncharacterized SAM-binding protein YcdF (DUF218 family)
VSSSAKKFKGIVLWILILFGFILTAAASRLATLIADPLVLHAVPQKSDVIVLMSHGQTGPEWLSPIGAQRTIGALKLYQDGYAPVIISSGSNPERSWDQAGLQAQWLARAGVPPSAILIERQSHRTYESAVEVSRIMQANNWKSLVVVVSTLDAPRVRAVFRKLQFEPSFLEVPETGPPKDWFSFGYLGLSYHAAYEYLGLVYYRYHGWI